MLWSKRENRTIKIEQILHISVVNEHMISMYYYFDDIAVMLCCSRRRTNA